MADDKLYEVEKILRRRVKAGRVEYFLKWKGYPSSENSWEPQSHVTPDLVAVFEARLQKHKTAQQQLAVNVSGATAFPSTSGSPSKLKSPKTSIQLSPPIRKPVKRRTTSAPREETVNTDQNTSHDQGMNMNQRIPGSPDSSSSLLTDSPTRTSVGSVGGNKDDPLPCEVIVDEGLEYHVNAGEEYKVHVATPLMLEAAKKIYKGLILKSINGVTKLRGHLFFYVSWQNDPQDDLIPSMFANEFWPQEVIRFYERHMVLIVLKGNKVSKE